MTKGHSKLETLIEKYPEVFQSRLGTMKSFRAYLHLKEGAHLHLKEGQIQNFVVQELSPLLSRSLWEEK